MGLFGRYNKARSDLAAIEGLLEGLSASSVQIVGDPGRVTEEQRAKLRTLGIDLDQVLAQQQAWVQPQAQAAGDDTLSRLERLAALRAQGVLTEAEFAEQKARILGGS